MGVETVEDLYKIIFRFYHIQYRVKYEADRYKIGRHYFYQLLISEIKTSYDAVRSYVYTKIFNLFRGRCIVMKFALCYIYNSFHVNLLYIIYF